MIVIDAEWEKKNIGVETKEIVVEKSDKKEDVLRQLQDICAKYLVVKVPADFDSMSFELATQDFVFIETMHSLANALRLAPINDYKKELIAKTQFVPMDDSDFDFMCQNIWESKMFRTDRIARDPFFSIELANRRYINWLGTERERGAYLYQYIYEGHRVGFDCFREVEEGIYDDFLSGIYTPYAGKGLSVNVSHKLNDFVIGHGGKKIITAISSTNVRSLNNHVDNGYCITGSNYIFVKHMNRT